MKRKLLLGLTSLLIIPIAIGPVKAVEYPFSTEMKVSIEKGTKPIYNSKSNVVYPVVSYFSGKLVDGGEFSLQHDDGKEIAYTFTNGKYILYHTVRPNDIVNYAPDTMTATKPIRVLLQGPIDLGHINFASGSAVLSADAKAALGEMALQMMASNLTAAYLVGTSDRVGSASSGLVISRKRVDAAAKYLNSRLEGMGIYNASIRTENMGEYLSNSRDGSANPEDRKVTVLIYPNFS